MLNLNKKVLLAALALNAACAPAVLRAQDINGLWHAAPAAYAETHGKPVLQPVHYTAFTAGEANLRAYLESSAKDYTSAGSIALPRPEGGYRTFRIWATPVMAEALAAKYPEITTYTAEATDNHNITAKIDYSPFWGMHAMVYNGSSSYLIDPYSGRADGAYIAYYKSDYSRAVGTLMNCENGEPQTAAVTPGTGSGALTHGTVRRKYRLALAADSEYCAAVAGVNPTTAAVLAKMVVSVNRVNGIYEREFAVTMELIANTNLLIFTGADPYTNNSGGTMLGQNQTTVTNIIGSANYDIGHVFSTGGGGIAFQGCVCSNNNKAKGVTGSASPVGDAFDVDYVSHEMGHQFGGSHTFNANTGSCNGNGNANTSYEPGSGSTIMAYAGICGGGNDFQVHSDPYFHSASLEEVTAFITSSGGTCAVTTASTNTNATVPGFSASYNIPYKTPFELSGPTATDATKDTITYCWEQRNIGGVDFKATLAATTTDGPLFRSSPPVTSTTRIFPSLRRLLIGPGTSTPGEKLPDVSRSLKFGYVERDVYQGWGAFNFSSDQITLNATSTSGPFTVTLPAGGENWQGGTFQTVTWDVANTTAAPVSCANVDIFLSMDGGNTFPVTLKTATPNDGSETVLIPTITTPITNARIKVKGTGNVFMSISPYDFNLDLGKVGVNGVNLNEGSVQVSPVPAESEVRVTLPLAAGVVEARLLNTLGQAVWNGTLKGEGRIAVGSLPRGVYYLRVAAEGDAAVTKAVTLR